MAVARLWESQRRGVCVGGGAGGSAHLASCSMVAAMPWLRMRRPGCDVTPRSAGRSDKGTEHGRAVVAAGVFH